MQPKILLVAFKTRPALPFDVNQLPLPGNRKTAEAIAKWKEEKAAEATEACLMQPYTATFEEVQIADTHHKEMAQWNYRDPASGRAPATAAIAQWLLRRYPEAWPHTTHTPAGTPQAIFVGFDTKVFLKILGIACSLPGQHRVELPLSLWYGNNDHRDIEAAVLPSDYSFLSWDLVLRARGLREAYPKWNGPHQDVAADLALTADLAVQMGMIQPAEHVAVTKPAKGEKAEKGEKAGEEQAAPAAEPAA